MSSMSKLLSSALVATLTLTINANANLEKELLNHVKKNIVKNPNVKVKGITLFETKKDARLPGWDIHMLTMDLNFNGKDVHPPQVMFVKDGLVTGSLVDLKTGEDYSHTIKPTVKDVYYDDAHLLFGNKDAKHKVLIFSDPQCPFCQKIIPDIFAAGKKNPKKLAIYYYHMPLLNIHPVSNVLTRVMHVAQHEGKMDILNKIYSLKINPREMDVKKILDAVSKHAGYTVTAKKIDDKSVIDAMKHDQHMAEKMIVTGTPTIYIDGVWDRTRDGYKKLIK